MAAVLMLIPPGGARRPSRSCRRSRGGTLRAVAAGVPAADASPTPGADQDQRQNAADLDRRGGR